MKKILLVTNGFYPEISPRSYRATELAVEFGKQGHDVVVLSKSRDFDYSDFMANNAVKIKTWGYPKLPQIPISGNFLSVFILRILRRLMLLLFEYPDIEDMFHVKKALRYEEGYDLMISFAVPYPVQWGVAWSQTKRHSVAKTWLADCGDPFMGNVLDSFKHAFYFKYLEKWFCRKTDYIIIPISEAKYGYYEEFHDKIRVIPQGFNFPLDLIKADQPANPIPTFAYAGGFLPGSRDPGPLLEFLSTLNSPFKFIIFTNDNDMVNVYQRSLGEKLIVSNYIPRPELMEILRKMDFLVNFDNNTTLNSPSKLIDYAIANRPVINITRALDKENLLAFLKGDYSRCMHIPDHRQYHISKISELFLSLLQ